MIRAASGVHIEDRDGNRLLDAFAGPYCVNAGYWQAIQNVLRKHDILLIADEVVTGFGRLGTMFGSDHYGIEADTVVSATARTVKALLG